MQIIGCDLHARQQTVAMLDTQTGEVVNRTLPPPYNIQIEGNVSGKGVVRHRNFHMASGEMNEFEFTSFLSTSLRLLAQHSTEGSIHFVCIDWRHLGELLNSGKQVYDSLLNVCVWVKDNGGQGSFYRSQHEFIFVFRNGKARHRNNVQLAPRDRGLIFRDQPLVWLVMVQFHEPHYGSWCKA
jgi:hypothetical protein